MGRGGEGVGESGGITVESLDVYMINTSTLSGGLEKLVDH